MNIGPFHWCMQETQALLMMLPFLGAMWFWVRSKFKKHEKAEIESHHNCCHPHDKH